MLKEKTARHPVWTLAVLVLAATVGMLPNSILFAATPDIAKHLLQPVTFVGFMVTVYSIAYVVSTPFLGVLSDHVGRKIILSAGLVLFAIGGMFPLFTQSSVLVLFGRAIMGVGSAGILPMVDSMLGDMYESGPQRRAALAAFSAAMAVADAGVPFLGGVLDAWQWKAVFAVYGLGLVTCLLTARMSVPNASQPLARMMFSTYWNGLRIAVMRPVLAATLLSTVLFGMLYFGFCSLLPMAPLRPVTGFASGTLFLPVGLFWVLTSAFLSRRAHMKQLHVVVTVTGLVVMAATLVMSEFRMMAVLLVVSAVWGAGSALLTTVYTWLIGDESPDAVRGAMNALYNAGYVLGFSVGSPVFLWLHAWLGYRTAIGCIALLLCASTFVGFRYLRPSQSPESLGAQTLGV